MRSVPEDQPLPSIRARRVTKGARVPKGIDTCHMPQSDGLAGPSRARMGTMDDEIRDHLLTRLDDERESTVRRAILETLAPEVTDPMVRSRLIRQLGAEDEPKLKLLILKSLGGGYEEDAEVRQIFADTIGSTDWPTRSFIIGFLASRARDADDVAAFDTLRRNLHHTDQATREQITEAVLELAPRGLRSLRKQVLTGLNSPDASLRIQAVRLLGAVDMDDAESSSAAQSDDAPTTLVGQDAALEAIHVLSERIQDLLQSGDVTELEVVFLTGFASDLELVADLVERGDTGLIRVEISRLTVLRDAMRRMTRPEVVAAVPLIERVIGALKDFL